MPHTPPIVSRAPVRIPAGAGVRGLGFMVAACAAFATMGALVYAAQRREPDASALVGSGVRISVNLLLVVLTAAKARDLHGLLGDARASLWARGAFGSFALMASFTSIRMIGIGEASFLHASSGVFVALLAPFFLKQKNALRAWVAIAGALVGLWLLFEPRLADDSPYGRALALASGLAAAFAYLMIARAGRSNPPSTVIFYFCIVAAGMHAVVFGLLDVTLPRQVFTWALLLTAGVVGSAGQSCLTRAYQSAPAALNSAVSYLQPVISLMISVLIFARHPDARAWLGAAIVVIFGVALPFARGRNVQ